MTLSIADFHHFDNNDSESIASTSESYCKPAGPLHIYHLSQVEMANKFGALKVGGF